MTVPDAANADDDTVVAEVVPCVQPGHVATVVVRMPLALALVMVEVEWMQPPDSDTGQTVTTTVLSGTSLEAVPVRLPSEVLVLGLVVIPLVPEGVALGEGEDWVAVLGAPLEEETGPEELDGEATEAGRSMPLVARDEAVSEQGTVRTTVDGPPLGPQVAQTVTVVVKPGGIELEGDVTAGRTLPVYVSVTVYVVEVNPPVGQMVTYAVV